jgi:hypothetical protein
MGQGLKPGVAEPDPEPEPHHFHFATEAVAASKLINFI